MQIDRYRLKQAIIERYDSDVSGTWTSIVNGDECLIWRAGQVIVRVSPAWRTIEELQWVHDLTLHCHQSIPEVVPPLPAKDQTTLFLLDGYPVTVFPFVDGASLNTENDSLREDAARLLAKIHNATSTWDKQNLRPDSKATRPQPIPPERYPEILQDDEFDQWLESLPEAGLVRIPIHGDYYRRNILATDEKITGVIDWDEAEIDYLVAELGWCIWEFCQNETGDNLDLVKARKFLDAYLQTSTVCSPPEIANAVNFIRLRLRNQSAHALASKERGDGWDQDYVETEMRAFSNLRDVKTG